MDTQTPTEETFTTILPVMIYTRLKGKTGADWQEFDHGEGVHHLPAELDIYVRIHNIDDSQLAELVRDLSGLSNLVFLNLSENRKISDSGLKSLKALPRITALSLSSCDITNQGLPYLQPLTRLETLDISYCNRITDPGLKALKSLPRLSYLDVRGCVKLTTAGLARFRKPGITIHR